MDNYTAQQSNYHLLLEIPNSFKKIPKILLRRDIKYLIWEVNRLHKLLDKKCKNTRLMCLSENLLEYEMHKQSKRTK